jgi:hypothetical protein
MLHIVRYLLQNGARPSINHTRNSALACVLRHVNDWEFRYDLLHMLLQVSTLGIFIPTEKVYGQILSNNSSSSSSFEDRPRSLNNQSRNVPGNSFAIVSALSYN